MKKRKRLGLMLALILCLSMISTTAFADSDAWDGRTQEEFHDGDGTEENPYQIANGAQFYYFTQKCETAYYELTDDIDLGNQPFPIISKFAGVLNGNNHKIVNLNITSGPSDYTAMIGTCTGTVKNLSVYGTVESTKSYTAAIVGELSGGTIENCQNYCTVNSTNSSGYTGGIAAYVSNKGKILDCANLGSICGISSVGGVAGYAGYTTDKQYASVGGINMIPSITGCQNVADITGKYAGGICSSQRGTTISECVNTGEVTGASSAAGIVCSAYSENCTSVTKVNGRNLYSYPKCSSFIHNCYNTGKVSAVNSASGIINSFSRCKYVRDGWHQSNPPSMGVTNCYNVGIVTATGEKSTFGDILGCWVQTEYSFSGTPERCLYLADNNSDADENLQTYGIACSDTELSTVGAYNNNAFDFDSVWAWDTTGVYPYAILQRVGLPLSVCNHNYVLTNSTATCTEAGTATYTCTKCGDSDTEDVAATGHSFTTKASESKATDATCTAAATYYVQCDNCDAVSNSVTVPVGDANGHSPAAAVRENEVAATCAAAGSYDEVVYCSVCNAEISRTQKTIDKLQHDFGNNLEYCKNGCGTKNPNYVPPYNPPHKPSVKPNPTPSKPETPENPFVDVKKDDYYYDAVIWAVGKGIAKGVTDTTFQPNASCTRAEMVTFLYRAAGSPEPTNKVNPFTDVAEDSYYYKAVLWAVEKGIAKGTSETTFSPNDTCTRGQAVAFLYRYANSPAVSGSNSFADVSETAYYYNAILWAVSGKVTEGTSATTFSPNDLCTRGQIVTFLYRYMGK